MLNRPLTYNPAVTMNTAYHFNDESLAYCSAESQMASSSLLSQGELCLLKGDLTGLDLFEKATQMDPCNPELFYRQGLALFEYGSEEGKEKALLLAGKKLKPALSIFPEHFDSWQAWGNALALLGLTYREHHYFLEAEEKLERAIALSEGKTADILADLFWDYGVVWMHIAIHSGEAHDWQKSMGSFQRACGLQELLPAEFWNDYGTACLHMSALVNDVRLNVKAINCFKHSVSISMSSFEGWGHLAKALQLLYGHTHDEDHFSQANECFAAAAHLRPQDTHLLIDWAIFLLESSRRHQDVKRLHACIEKCHRSHACDPKQPLVIAIWAEALALIGEISERLDLLSEAENKISEAVELSEEEDPEVWYSYGMILNSMGSYFGDLDYFFQAIEKFQFGLSLDRTRHRLWHAIGKAYAKVAEKDDDLDSSEKSVRFMAKALELYACSDYSIDYALALSQHGELKGDQKFLEEAILHYEHALQIQKNAIYIHPQWVFHYAEALDMLGDFYEDEAYYLRSIEILSHVLMIDPDFPRIHHRLALAYAHLGDLMGDLDHLHRAVHHFRLASKHEEENDQIILDWGMALINLGHHLHEADESDQLFRDAEHKLTQAAKLGNQHAYYHLACLYSILAEYDRAMHFVEKSHAFKALPPVEEILEDEWLDGLRQTSHFQEFLLNLKPNS